MSTEMDVEIMGSRMHSRVQMSLAAALDKFDNFVGYTELSLDINGEEYKPDICLYPIEYEVNNYFDDEIRVKEIPLLVVEILSPRQYIENLSNKFKLYFQAGVVSCWLVIPMAKTIIVYHSPEQLKSFSDGDVMDNKLNIKLPLSNIFKRKIAC